MKPSAAIGGIVLIVLIAAGWWFGYGRPAAEYFRSQDALRAAMTRHAPNTSTTSGALTPLVTVQQSVTLGSITSSLASVTVYCSYSKLWNQPAFSLIGLEVALDQSAMSGVSRSLVLDSLAVQQTVVLIDTVLAAGRPFDKTATTISGDVGDMEVVLSTPEASRAADIVTGGHHFFLERRELARLGTMLADGWATCGSKIPH